MQIEANIRSHLFPPICCFLLKWHFIIITFLFFLFSALSSIVWMSHDFPSSSLIFEALGQT